jgi:hypothetical protein
MAVAPVGPQPPFKDAAMKLFSLALAAILALAPGQDKVTLKFNPKKGDKLSKVEKNEMAIHATVTANGQEQKLEFGQRESETSTIEYLEVADGAPTKAIVSYKEAIEEKKGPQGDEWEKTEKPLHGRKITVTKAEGKIVTEGADGLDEKTKKKLDLSDRTSKLFPKTPVGPGDSWDVAGDEVRSFMEGDETLKDAKIKMKFVEIKDIDGKRCAVLNAVMDLAGKAPGEIDVVVKLEAEVVVWIERGYALKVAGKGKMTMKGANDQFQMKGEGPMSLEIITKVE